MAWSPLTVDNLTPRGRRGRILTILSDGPMGFSDVCRAYSGDGARDRVERCRMRSALKDLRNAGWAAGTEWGWTLTVQGVDALNSLNTRAERIAA